MEGSNAATVEGESRGVTREDRGERRGERQRRALCFSAVGLSAESLTTASRHRGRLWQTAERGGRAIRALQSPCDSSSHSTLSFAMTVEAGHGGRRLHPHEVVEASATSERSLAVQ